MRGRLSKDNVGITRSLLCLALLAPAPWTARALAQEAEAEPGTGIFGWVLLEGSQTPVPAAQVELVIRADTAVADSVGFYSFAGLQAGADSIRVRYLQFRSLPTPFEIVAGKMTQIDLLLSYPTAEVDELVVEVERTRRTRLDGFYRRMEVGYGRYVTREEIDLFSPNNLSDMLVGMPGIRPVYIQGRRVIRMRGSSGQVEEGVRRLIFGYTCQPYIYLNGVRADFFEVDDIFPESVEGVEVYAGPYVPPEFYRLNRSCGTIAIWTR